jgi:predicted transcriptional regulator of viral defense system
MIVSKFSKFPVIRFSDIERETKSKEYAWILIHRLTREGKLKRVTKGVYTLSDDVFAISSNIRYPSYISFLTASYLNGFTETIPKTVFIATTKRYRAIDFDGYKIQFIALNSIWGYHKEEEGQHLRFVADNEKLMIDAFLYPNAMGNFNEIENIFKNAEINQKKLIENLRKINSQSIFRRVGYLLEKYKSIDISNSIKFDRNYCNLDPFSVGKKLDKKWRLLV